MGNPAAPSNTRIFRGTPVGAGRTVSGHLLSIGELKGIDQYRPMNLRMHAQYLGILDPELAASKGPIDYSDYRFHKFVDVYITHRKDLFWSAAHKYMSYQENLARDFETKELSEGILPGARTSEMIYAHLKVVNSLSTKIMQRIEDYGQCEIFAIKKELEPFKRFERSEAAKMRAFHHDVNDSFAEILFDMHGVLPNIQSEINSINGNVILMSRRISIPDINILENEKVVGVIRGEGCPDDNVSVILQTHGKAGTLIEDYFNIKSRILMGHHNKHPLMTVNGSTGEFWEEIAPRHNKFSLINVPK